MSKLVVLSEVNCLGYLVKHGIYPGQFFTDIQAFENMSSFFTDVKVVCILSGNSLFSKAKQQEVFKFLETRMQDEDSTSIKEYFILSDFALEGRPYFRYDKTLSSLQYVTGKRSVPVPDFWKKLDYEPSKTVSYLCARDKGDLQLSMERYKRLVDTHDTSFELAIKKPELD